MKRIIIGLVLVVVLGGVWFVTKDDSPKSEETVKIGGLFALSGYASFAGEASRDGMLMAIEDSGMKVDYVIEDFKSDQKSAVSSASKLLNIDKVDVVIGPEWAEFGEVVSSLSMDKKIPFISTWMDQETDWNKNNDYFFSSTPSTRKQNAVILDYMVKNNQKNIVIVYSNNSFSISNVALLKEEVQNNGSIKIVGEFKSSETETDFRPDILKINQLKPDAIYSTMSNGGSHGIFSKQLKDLGYSYPIYTTNGVIGDSVIRDRFLNYITGQIYTRFEESKNNKEFQDKYEKRFGKKVGAITAATTYDITTLVLKFIKDGAKDSEDIKNYLKNLSNYEGYSGVITFNQYGQVEGGGVSIRKVMREGDQELR